MLRLYLGFIEQKIRNNNNNTQLCQQAINDNNNCPRNILQHSTQTCTNLTHRRRGRRRSPGTAQVAHNESSCQTHSHSGLQLQYNSPTTILVRQYKVSLFHKILSRNLMFMLLTSTCQHSKVTSKLCMFEQEWLR